MRASAPRCRPSATAMRAGRARVHPVAPRAGPRRARSMPALSLAPVAARLSELLGKPVPLRKDWLDGVDCAAGSAVLCENVRFNKGEKKDDEALARQHGRAVRCVRHGRLRHRASRRGQHPRRGALRAGGLRRAAAGGRARGARARARRSRRGRWWRSSAARRSRPSSRCSRRCSTRSTS